MTSNIPVKPIPDGCLEAPPHPELPVPPILIVDDQPENLWYLEDVLGEAGFTNCRTTTNARNAVGIWAEFQPDLILLDLHMPEMDGIAVMRELGTCLSKDEYLPVLILTSDASSDAKERAFAAGAADFLTKPCCPADVVLRVRTFLRARAMFTRLVRRNEDLEAADRVKTPEPIDRATSKDVPN